MIWTTSYRHDNVAKFLFLLFHPRTSRRFHIFFYSKFVAMFYRMFDLIGDAFGIFRRYRLIRLLLF